jgi:hypothetical protein
VLIPVCAQAQLFTLTKEQMIACTSENPFDRFADGRPKVPDELLDKVKGLLIEEAYGVVRGKGFVNQFAGDWKILNVTPNKKLVGRGPLLSGHRLIGGPLDIGRHGRCGAPLPRRARL